MRSSSTRTGRTWKTCLIDTFGQPNSGKLDFNNASQQALRRPPARAAGSAPASPLSEQQLQRPGRATFSTFRNSRRSPG